MQKFKTINETNMKKIISFCVWGNNPKYCIGAIKNSILSKQIYPDWISRFYIHFETDENIKNELIKNGSEVVVIKDNIGDWSNMFWRFNPAYDLEVETFICRDTDSRLNERERDAVFEWMNSDKHVHIMRDHPYHGFAMLGGMIGFKKESFDILKNSLSQFSPENAYGNDYVFFQKILYPRLFNSSLIHDEFFQKNPFPSKRVNYEFVGEVFDENENTVPEHTEALKALIKT